MLKIKFDVTIYTNHLNDRGGTPSGSGGGRTTPSHMIRPIPHHVHHQQQVPQLQVNYSPVNVPRFSQSPVSEVKLGISSSVSSQSVCCGPVMAELNVLWRVCA